MIGAETGGGTGGQRERRSLSDPGAAQLGAELRLGPAPGTEESSGHLSGVPRTSSAGLRDPLAAEKGMATRFSVLYWRIPWTEEPGRLQSRGLQSQTRLSD